MNNTWTFIYLNAFSSQGGIEKFNRVLLKAFKAINFKVRAFSFYDKQNEVDENYFSCHQFRGKLLNKYITLIVHLIRIGLKPTDHYIIGHVNLVLVIRFIRFFQKKKRIILIAHGIEVWNENSKRFSKDFQLLDEIWAVSQYTKDRIVELHQYPQEKIKIFPNTLDPELIKLGNTRNETRGFKQDTEKKAIITVARLSSNEAYKGYDRIIEALVKLENENFHYYLIGKSDAEEKSRIEQLVQLNHLENKVTLCGFVNDQTLIDYYRSADLFVMPSLQEGFGIVFLEAMYFGLPVIGGNRDGSADALKNGELGTLVNPTSIKEISEAIESHLKLENGPTEKENIRNAMLAAFGFDIFVSRLQNYMNTSD